MHGLGRFIFLHEMCERFPYRFCQQFDLWSHNTIFCISNALYVKNYMTTAIIWVSDDCHSEVWMALRTRQMTSLTVSIPVNVAPMLDWLLTALVWPALHTAALRAFCHKPWPKVNVTGENICTGQMKNMYSHHSLKTRTAKLAPQTGQ